MKTTFFVLSVASLAFGKAYAEPEGCCPPDGSDCICVTGELWWPGLSYEFGTYSLSLVGGGAGGGGLTANFLSETAVLYDNFYNPASLAVSQGYAIDQNDDGVQDGYIDPNFLVRGSDLDNDGLPDYWVELVTTGMVWVLNGN